MASISLRPITGGPVHHQWRAIRVKPRPPPKGTSFAGKTAVITGANAGLGEECASQMLELNLSHLIIAVRRVNSGEEVAATLKKAHPDAKIDVWALDMLSYESIQAFAEKCKTLPGLDIAILNAGVNKLEPKFASTGHEETFQVNYLSTVLLAILLLPILSNKEHRKLQEPGRLAFIGSGLANIAGFPERNAVPIIPAFDDLSKWNVQFAMDRYSTTKALLHVLTLKLSEIVSSDDVIINNPDPGYTKGTQLLRESPTLMKPIVSLSKALLARSLKEGMWAYIDAVSVRGKESHGCFICDWQILPFHRVFYTTEGRKTAGRLWEETLQELSFASVRDILDSMQKKA
ncbi:NAD(P)-binding protein [Lojkania enalia]|uniref:NAD(P)-binding protein n=1 Tax=Lojkania enalia TaxID=147567 RepID=A0A9P4K7A2_9PLEO|nr:NAD(P)-binding protein [Didymosphaeria enalia]